MNLIPAKTFTKEYVEEICKENIYGVIISVLTRGDSGEKLPGWWNRNVDLFHTATFGFFGVNSENERFTSNTSFHRVTYNIASPILNPNYSFLFYNEKFNLQNMAGKYIDEMRRDRIDMVSFVLDDIYNLYIYYFSIGVYPVNDVLAEILLSMDIHDIELPSTDDYKAYFDALFSYVKIIGVEAKDDNEFKDVAKTSRWFMLMNRGHSAK
jgi:hypothetical protein